MKETKSYYTIEYKGFRGTFYKKIKHSLKWYAYQLQFKLTNSSNKNYTWYTFCLNESLDENRSEVAEKADLIQGLKYMKRLINSKIKDFRFPY